jgi:hypothetical protein
MFVVLLGGLSFCQSAGLAADALEKKPSASTSLIRSGLSQDHLVQGLKEALAKGVEHSITNLSREGGYLHNIKVKIQMPEKLAPIEKTLRALKQDHLVDEFITNMNHAAELAVGEVGPIFSQAIQNMALLKGPDDAATQYFKKVSEKRLQEKMLPIIEKTTESAGATASYKKVMEKASLGASF